MSSIFITTGFQVVIQHVPAHIPLILSTADIAESVFYFEGCGSSGRRCLSFQLQTLVEDLLDLAHFTLTIDLFLLNLPHLRLGNLADLLNLITLMPSHALFGQPIDLLLQLLFVADFSSILPLLLELGLFLFYRRVQLPVELFLLS